MDDAHSIVTACPNLGKLRFALREPTSLSFLQPFSQLKCLAELSLQQNHGYGFTADDAAALGGLVGLRKLRLFVWDIGSFLSDLTSLTNLTALGFQSFSGPGGLPVPEFTRLASLHKLRRLAWTFDDDDDDDGGVDAASDVTLSALCTCTQLTNLDLRNYDIVGTANVEMLASMPRLEELSAWTLQPDKPVLVPSCKWRRLILGCSTSPQHLAMLPLCGADFQHLVLGDSAHDSCCWWDLGPAHTIEATAVVADVVRAAAQILARAQFYTEKTSDRLGAYCGTLDRLTMSSEQVPAHPTAPVLAATDPFGKHVKYLELGKWNFDGALGVQLASTMPKLETLRLRDCRVTAGGWAALHRLQKFNFLWLVSVPVSSEAVVLFAVDVEWPLLVRLCDAGSLMEDGVLEHCQELINENREVRGRGAVSVTLER